MPTYRITYEGSASLAVRAASMLAEADGVELTSSSPPARRDGPAETVVLMLMAEGTPEAVMDAVELIRDRLPSGARIEIEDDTLDAS